MSVPLRTYPPITALGILVQLAGWISAGLQPCTVNILEKKPLAQNNHSLVTVCIFDLSLWRKINARARQYYPVHTPPTSTASTFVCGAVLSYRCCPIGPNLMLALHDVVYSFHQCQRCEQIDGHHTAAAAISS